MPLRTVVRTAAGVAALGAGTLAYAGLVERRWYRLRHATVPALRATATRPLRVLHLSDLHLLPGQEDKHAFVRSCLATSPDLVVATGDFLGHPDAVGDAVDLLAGAGDGRPALAVLGSNDVYAPKPKNPLDYLVARDKRTVGVRMDTDRLVTGLRDGGWTFLDNARTTIDTVAGPVDCAGLGDAHVGWDHPEQVDWSPPGDGCALRLGVLHAPYLRALDVFGREGYDLVLAGHTHGGQLRVPGYGALVANCDLPLSQARGLSRHPGGGGSQGGSGPPLDDVSQGGSGPPLDDVSQGGSGPPLDDGRTWLHVSAGLGTSMYAPVRFSCRPEATLLDVVPAV